MPLMGRSLVFFLAVAMAIAAPGAPALKAQTLSEPLSLICEAAREKPVKLRIDYEHVNVNGVVAQFTHDQISWQAPARNGATENFIYHRNDGLLTDEIKPGATKPASAAAPPRPAAAGLVYHCRRAG
jgi:hypothetical protein